MPKRLDNGTFCGDKRILLLVLLNMPYALFRYWFDKSK